jgi:2'-5' RNA ligase
VGIHSQAMLASSRSVVLVPAHGAGELVQELRIQHDPSAAAGVPTHLTLMFPFVPPPDLSAQKIDALESLIGRARPFDFTLTRIREFKEGVVYLVPEPAGPFVSLTQEIARHFGLLPFGGQFGEDPVIHLTIANHASPSDRRRITDRLSPELPISLRAVEAWLMIGSNTGGWNVARKMPFGESAKRAGRP